MLAWMLYALTVAALLTLAAGCAAHAARRRFAPTRLIWAAALAASLLIPAAIPSISLTLPRLSPAGAPRTIALRDLAPPLVAPAKLLAALPPQSPIPRRLGATLPTLWAALSAALAIAFAVNAAALAWRQRHWRSAIIAGAPVRVAPDAGPALAGLLFPKIVVPAWLVDAPAETQRHVIAHEQSHLAAGDTRLLAAALALVVLMPWNLPLWWQLRRLRLALETDCDARVIAAGASPARYAETLIAIGERRARRLAPAMAMAEPASDLEQRIRLMLSRNRRTALTRLTALAAIPLALAAAAVAPPDAPAPPDLARFTGAYQMSPDAVLTVAQQDGALVVRLTGQPPLRVTPKGPASFTADIVGAQFDFDLPGSGPASSVTLHQHGQVIAMPRIDAAQAQRIEAGTAARISRDTPAPGSRLALSRIVDGIIANAPDYSAMTPKLASVVQTQLPALHDGIAGMGPVAAINFLRVGSQGEDIYLVKQKSGAATWRIVLSGGKIAGLWVSPAP